MKLIDEVQSIVEDTICIPFLYASYLNLNSWADYSSLPCVACQQLVNGSYVNEGGLMKDSANFLLMFLDKTETDRYTALENQTIIDKCKERMVDFVRAIDSSTEIMYETGYTYDFMYQEFDVDLTGIALTITIKERSGEQPCL